jgi:hypothetical protein
VKKENGLNREDKKKDKEIFEYKCIFLFLFGVDCEYY